MDPLSITASVAGLVTFALTSARSLNDLVSAYKGASNTLQSLSTDVQAVQGLLNSLSSHLVTKRDSDLSDEQKAALQDLRGPLQGTQVACEAVRGKIQSIMSHSSESRTSKRDRFDLMWSDKEVNLRRAELSKYQLTLSAAIGLVNL